MQERYESSMNIHRLQEYPVLALSNYACEEFWNQHGAFPNYPAKERVQYIYSGHLCVSGNMTTYTIWRYDGLQNEVKYMGNILNSSLLGKNCPHQNLHTFTFTEKQWFLK